MRLRLALLLALCCAALAPTLTARSFIRDDRVLIADNPTLAGPWSALFTTGYWESAWGSGATVAEYRPLPLLLWAAELRLFGPTPGAFHAVNIFLHFLVSALVFLRLRSLMAEETAWFAAFIFAVLPVHVEAAAGLTGGTELLAAVFLLSSWTQLDPKSTPKKTALGVGSFALALLSKEHAVLFPAALALSDWTFFGRLPWERKRRAVYAGLAGCVALYLVVRAAVLSDPLAGGLPYFHGVSFASKILTAAKFWLMYYAWPAFAGFPLINDFSRPFFSDAQLGDASAWLALLVIASIIGTAAWAAIKRSQAAFWTLWAALFLLPTSHLLFPLDTLGAQRFLYLPGLAAACALAWTLQRFGGKSFKTAAAALLAAYTALSFQHSSLWTSSERYYEHVVSRNPESFGGWIGLGAAAIDNGDPLKARACFMKANAAHPKRYEAHYNLARLYWDSDRMKSESELQKAAVLAPEAWDALALLGAAAQEKGRLDEAKSYYERALRQRPNDPLLRQNLSALAQFSTSEVQRKSERK